MIKKLSSKLVFLLAIAFAAMTGGITTAVVMAAIPSTGGTISSCYVKSTGRLRVIDTQAGATCKGAENALNWSSSGGAQIAHAAFNDDGTLNTAYSSNILAAKEVDSSTIDSGDPNYTACFKVSFNPKSLVDPINTNPKGGVRAYGPAAVALIDQFCGSDYNAAVIDEAPIPGSGRATDLQAFNYTFFQ